MTKTVVQIVVLALVSLTLGPALHVHEVVVAILVSLGWHALKGGA